MIGDFSYRQFKTTFQIRFFCTTQAHIFPKRKEPQYGVSKNCLKKKIPAGAEKYFRNSCVFIILSAGEREKVIKQE